MKYDIKNTQELNLNLYHLWLSLQDLEREVYPKNVEKKLINLIHYIDSILFKPIPSGYDIVDVKCLYTTYFERFKSKHN